MQSIPDLPQETKTQGGKNPNKSVLPIRELSFFKNQILVNTQYNSD